MKQSMTLEQFREFHGLKRRDLRLQGRKDKHMRRVSIINHQPQVEIAGQRFPVNSGNYVEAMVEIAPGNWQRQVINRSLCVRS